MCVLHSDKRDPMSSDALATRRRPVTLGEVDDDNDGDCGGNGAVVEGHNCKVTTEAQGMTDPAGIVMKSRREIAALRSTKAKMAFFHNFILERRGALKLYKTKNQRTDVRHHYIKPKQMLNCFPSGDIR